MEVPVDTQVWLKRPPTEAPAWKGQGRRPCRKRLAAEAPAPQSVAGFVTAFGLLNPAEIAAQWPAERWQRYTLHEGSKGPLVADAACERVVVGRDGLPGPEVWLVVRRDAASGEIKYFLSNAPRETPQAQLTWLSAARWPMEQSIEDWKDKMRMNQYAMRSWRGWYHHVSTGFRYAGFDTLRYSTQVATQPDGSTHRMTLVMIAHLFLVTVQQELKEDAPALTVPQARMLLQAVLPRPVFDVEAALEALRQIQRANHLAYLSHRKRTLKKLGVT